MKKVLFLLITLIVLSTGCEVYDIEDKDVNKVIDEALKSENGATEIYNGFKFYLPKWMKIVDKSDDNLKIRFNSDFYYLFVDIVSYYHIAKKRTMFL